jgi:hypothetical protein
MSDLNKIEQKFSSILEAIVCTYDRKIFFWIRFIKGPNMASSG